MGVAKVFAYDDDDYEVRYHHIDAPDVCGVSVEVHFRPLFLDSPLRNWRLQRWFRENRESSESNVHACLSIAESRSRKTIVNEQFGTLSPHSSPDHDDKMQEWAKSTGKAAASNEEIMHTLGQFGMKKFAGAMMYVLQTVFAMPDEYLICQPNVKEGRFLLSEILQAGNFGAFDQRIKRDYRLWMNDYRLSLPRGMVHAFEKTKHNMRLLTHYPEEVLSEPFFRLYHYLWRKLELWRF